MQATNQNDPKILFFDLETSDLDADIGHIITIGYKWAHESKVTVIDITQHPGKALNDDSALIKAFEPVWDQADLIVHHFGEFFDEPFLQTRRLIHGMKPMPPIARVDTWRIAKKRLKLRSNRLERILDVLGCPFHKTPIRLSVWAAARCGDKKAIQYIREHNKNDILVLEWVYNKIRPVWNQHPALVRGQKDNLCPLDGRATKSLGRRLCRSNWYQRRVCTSCGHVFNGKKLEAGGGVP